MPQTQAPPRTDKQVTILEDTSWERVWSSEASRGLGYVRPWASLAVTFGVGALTHALWGHMPDVPWAASTLAVAAVGMPGFAWLTSRLAPIGRAHSAATVGALMAWLDIATITGPTAQLAGGLIGLVGGCVALSWNIRGNARNRITDAHRDGREPADRLAAWFADAAKEAGIGGATLTGIVATPTKATGTVQLEDGKTAADLLSKVPAIESAAKLPPGAIITTLDPDRADHAGFTMSDPRVLTRPIPWPGPSAPGQSIAKPLRPGLWQTGDPVYYVIVGQSIYMMGASGSGKALALDTPIPTPDGWTAMGDLRTGDTVFDENGQPCQVTSAWDTRYGRPCYEVEFSDGSAIVADAEHQWLTDTHRSRVSGRRALRGDKRPRRTTAHRPQQYKRTFAEVTTTERMAATLMDGKHANHSVRVAAPLACPDKNLPVPPYTLGAWLGDGSSRTGQITCMDPEIIAEVEAEGLPARIVPAASDGGRAKLYRITGLTKLLRNAGILAPNGRGHGELHGAKHIPAAYLRASETQRRALLAGLLDTDGYCTKTGSAEFSVTCEPLARDTFHLAASLGYKPSLRSKPVQFRGKDCGTAWTVSFTTADKVFRLPRKAARQVTTMRPTSVHRYVTAVRPVPSVPVRCIAVDSPNHLFLAGPACIPTHNSIGGGWNLLGEAMTRPDCAIIGADITKGEQTFGPLRPAFHRFERDIKGTRDMVGGMAEILQPRTDYLAERGLQKWAEGCGLSYLIAWFEETGDIFDKIGGKGEDQLINAARALRSAGGTLVFSVQRNTFDQVPTLIRGQMASMCFGLNDPQDNRFGLSEAQQNAGVNPAEWGIRHPGKAVLDAASIPEELITTPLRTYDWGGNADLMTAHAAAWPASMRPVDPITARIVGGPVASDGPLTGLATDAPAEPSTVRPSVTLTAPDDDQAPDDDGADSIGDPVGEYLDGADDPSPDITAAAIADGPDAPIEADPTDVPFDFEPGPQMSPEDARRVFADQLAAWRDDGRDSFAPRDFAPVMRTTGMRRGWIQKQLKAEIEADEPQIERDDKAGCYRFTGR
jgi:hypothetical protein